MAKQTRMSGRNSLKRYQSQIVLRCPCSKVKFALKILKNFATNQQKSKKHTAIIVVQLFRIHLIDTIKTVIYGRGLMVSLELMERIGR